MKKIDKIVMYKAIEDGKTVVKSCIFYDDGSYEKIKMPDLTERLLPLL